MNRLVLGRNILVSSALFVSTLGSLVVEAQSNTFPQGNTEAPILSMTEKAVLEDDIRRALQKVVDKQERIEGQGQSITVKVVVPDAGDKIMVNLGRGYKPAHDGAAFEDIIHELETTFHAMMWKRNLEYHIDFFFGDMSIGEFLEIEDSKLNIEPQSRVRRDVPSAKSTVVVAAGHGMYYHRGFKKWTYQRDQHNGIVEDMITPSFSRRLARYLEHRGSVEVARARSDSLDRFEDSGLTYYQLGARYRLKSLLPDAPQIWNSQKTDRSPLIERDQDIRSRPYYANHLNAAALIHLHTNANDDPDVRGLSVYYAQGRSDSMQFARIAACYMKESIRSIPSYSDYPVRENPLPGGHGENRYANMPSIIAEVGFHTNAEDARAIQHPVFQDAAMRGLEKGYRMFREGKGCEPFTVAFPDADLVSGDSKKIDVTVGGNPRYPIRYTMRVVECTRGILCVGGSGVFYDATEAHSTTRSCHTASQPFKIVWEVSARDEDGIVATTQTSMNCQPKV